MENKNIDKTLVKLTTEAIETLDIALGKLFVDRGEEYSIGKLGMAIGLIREFQKPIFEKNPSLRPPPPEDYIPAPPLTKEQLALIETLNEVELNKIDEIILSNADQNWRKVACIIGKTMQELPENMQKIPENYYPQRLTYLVEEGKLESQGDLAYMRYSEVRIPSKK